MHYRGMSFGQNVALVMVNKSVKFDEKSLHFVKVVAENRQIYKIAIYGKVTLAPSGHVF